MRRHPTAPLLLLFSLVLLPARPAAAQGWIEPRPGIAPATWQIEKQRTVVNVRITGRVATVEVEEWFRNTGSVAGEGDYTYPLPGEAVFTGYSLYQGDAELRGEMMDAARAREIYESIVRARQDPALIELLGKGMIRARVFPIAAGESRRITLRYTQVLERAGDGLQFRYAAGGRHAAAWPMGVRQVRAADTAPVTFTITITDGAQYRDPYSPTHGVRAERRGGTLTVRPRAELGGDFAVFLPFATSAVGMTVATHAPAGEDGYFMLTLSPAAVAASRIPRDITAVVDVSGSMSGEKMEQARRALHQLLGTLEAQDRVRLIAFSSRVQPWREEWTPATRTELRAAAEWVDGLRADGGTNIADALALALREKSPAERLPIVVFLTDGLPTAGETRADRIIALAEAERDRARVFAFGVGWDVNTQLLDGLTEAARGTTQYVAPGEDVEQPVSALAARIRYPVLTDLALQRGPVRLSEVYPRQIPDLFAGEDLILFGRFEGSGTGELAVTGRREGRTERFAATVAFPRREAANDYIPRLWAARRLGDLDRRLRSAQADGAGRRQLDELREEMRQLALRYGLLSEYTAYLVQEPVLAAAPQPVPGQTQGVVRNSAPASLFTGQAAVQRAEAARVVREVAVAADLEAAAPVPSAGPAAEGARRTVAGRTFTLKGGVWRDVQEAAGSSVVHVEPWSAAYFDLVQALPELAAVLRHVQPVRLAGARVVIEVSPGGLTTLAPDALGRAAAAFRGR